MLISARTSAKVLVEPCEAILFLGNLCPHESKLVRKWVN